MLALNGRYLHTTLKIKFVVIEILESTSEYMQVKVRIIKPNFIVHNKIKIKKINKRFMDNCKEIFD